MQTVHSHRGIIRCIITITMCSALQGCYLTLVRQESVHPDDVPTALEGPVASNLEAPVPALASGEDNLSQLLWAKGSADPKMAAQGPEDLWTRIRNGFSLTPSNISEDIKAEIGWFDLKQHYLDKVAERASPYLYHIVEEVERRDMPMEIALLPIIESAYRAEAYSPGKAAGIWQLAPGTGVRLGLKETAWYDGRRDVVASTDAALDYLETLHDKFGGNWLHALAAYNCGEGTLKKAIGRNRAAGRPTDYWSLDLPAETEHFVPKLLATASILDNPGKYRLALDAIPNRPYLAEVKVKGPLKFAEVAALAQMSVVDLQSLNPGFPRSAVGPGRHTLVIPLGKASALKQRLVQSPDEENRLHKQNQQRNAPIGSFQLAGNRL